jgi:nondiscriminating aspartyl-tRNA synthetase
VNVIMRTLCAELSINGQPTTIEGWIHRRRQLAAITFLVIRDRSGLAQVVITDESTRAVVAELPEETVVRIQGPVIANSGAPGGLEITDPTVTALSDPALTPPLELWRPRLREQMPARLDHAAVSWRHLSQRAVWQVAAASLAGFRHHLDDDGFTEIHTPKLVATSTETGANVFPVDYFGQKAFLAQSPQFYKQTMVGVFERVYEVGPVFRAEPHETARHLAEYVSLDAELGFIQDHRDVLTVLHSTLQAMLDAIHHRSPEALELTDASLPRLPDTMPVLHFRDALKLVGADPSEPDLAPEHERMLGHWAAEKHGSDFVAVEGYPTKKRPFYTFPQPDDQQWTNSFDVLFRGLELVTGGQRRHNYADYVEALHDRGEETAPYASYLAAFQHGMPPHGGFAIGLERWTSRVLGLDNVRQATLFPRDRHRLTP